MDQPNEYVTEYSGKGRLFVQNQCFDVRFALLRVQQNQPGRMTTATGQVEISGTIRGTDGTLLGEPINFPARCTLRTDQGVEVPMRLYQDGNFRMCLD